MIGAPHIGKTGPSVIPAQAGIQFHGLNWTPASAGVTGMETRKGHEEGCRIKIDNHPQENGMVTRASCGAALSPNSV